MTKGIKGRLYPNEKQKQQLLNTFGCCRFVYNYFLYERARAYKEDNISLSYNDTARLLVKMKHEPEYVWLSAIDSMALQESLRNLDKAYKNFFKGNARYPIFHSKHGKQSFRTRNQNNGIRLSGNMIKLPKVGYVKVKGLQDFDGRILNVTVSLSKSGKFFVSLCVDTETFKPTAPNNAIGLDVGLTSFYTDSNGNTVANPRTYRYHEKRLIRAQRRLSRMKKGSNNRNKQRIRVARCHEKISNIRNDFLQKQSTILANENQVVCVEDLQIRGMLKNHRLAKSISDVAWSSFFRMLDYKLQERGGTLIKIPAFYPSSQTCSVCNYLNKDLKNLSVRQWTCPVCGAQHDRDVNAAQNILKQGLQLVV